MSGNVSLVKSDSSATSQPTVSVVMPTHGRPDYLRRAIASVARQTYNDWELIVVDDNGADSTMADESRAVVEAWSTDDRVRYIAHPSNRGGSAARNTGLGASRGEYVAFLDDDDEWFPAKLEAQLGYFATAPSDVALVTCGFKRVWPDGREEVQVPDDRALTLERILMSNTVGTTSAVVGRRADLLAVGGFDEKLRSKQDIDLYVRLAQNYRLASVPDILLAYYVHSGPKIVTNLAGTLSAHLHFDNKHAELLASHPRAHGKRLKATARLLREAGRSQEARDTYVRAWRVFPRDLGPLLSILLTAPPLTRFVGWLRSLRRALRSNPRRT